MSVLTVVGAVGGYAVGESQGYGTTGKIGCAIGGAIVGKGVDMLWDFATIKAMEAAVNTAAAAGTKK